MFSLSPEIERLRDSGAIRPEAAAVLLSRERREVVEVTREVRMLLWGGVMLIATGVGIVVSRNLEQIGPLVVAMAIGVAALACYAWCFWRRGRVSLVNDYVLLLASLLLSADVGFIEHNFHLLGDDWHRHFLLLTLIHAVVAYFFQSRMVLSLSLTALAAWCGLERNVDTIFDSAVVTASRAFQCAALVVVWRLVDGRASRRDERAASRDFAPVFEHFAATLAFWGGLALTFGEDTRLVGCLIVLTLAAISAWYGLKTKSEPFVVYAWIYGIIALNFAVFEVIGNGVVGLLFAMMSTVLAIVGLFVIHSRMKRADA